MSGHTALAALACGAKPSAQQFRYETHTKPIISDTSSSIKPASASPSAVEDFMTTSYFWTLASFCALSRAETQMTCAGGAVRGEVARQ